MSLPLATNEIEDVPDISIDCYRAGIGPTHDASVWVYRVDTTDGR
jgi:hypothetical protein